MESNNLENLKKKLYQKGRKFPARLERETFRQEENPANPYWQKEEPAYRTEGLEKSDTGSFVVYKNSLFGRLKIFAYLLIIFVILAGGGAAYMMFSGGNIVSSSNVSIDANGPIYVDGGQQARFNFTIRNQNSVSLEAADLIFDFPSNTFSAEGASLTRTRIALGNLEQGATINKSLDIVFFGLENEEKKITASLEYRFADSNATFVKSKDYSVKISKAPLGLSLVAPKNAVSGQKISIKIAVISNSESAAKSLKMEMKYPPGFRFNSAEPSPSKGDNIWTLGDIGPSQKSNITIEGTIEGENSEERTFTATVGTLGDDGNIKPFGTASEKVAIKKSPLNLTAFINGKNDSANTAYAGEMIRVDLTWVNNLSSSIKDAQIELEIKGEAYDQRSVSVTKGAYRSYDNKAVWNSASLKDLASIAPGSSGKTQLGFSIKNPLPIYKQGDKDFSISIEARIIGLGTSDEFENKQIEDSIKKDIKVGSKLQAVGKTLHYSGALKNSGEVPPKVGKETTYTIVWSLANNANDLSDAKITASLPPYVSKENLISPEDADLQFDEKNATLVWNVGEVPAGTGIIMPAKEVSFQVSFSPNLTQVGETPVLVNKAVVEARDAFTEENISAEIPALTINLSGDPQSKGGEDKVRE
mgnify:CR=1 FL=1